jgi:hypothetical protein
MAYMIIEIILMQKYALFIGTSIYSISTVLITLLITSGIGSRFADKFNNIVPFLIIAGWTLLDIFAFTPLVYSLGDLDLIWRVFITALLIAPLGFFMGMPFPKAGLRVGSLIDWGFAVNGAASVLGSTLIILVAIEYGFAISLIIGVLLYLIAMALIGSRRSWQ